MYTIYLLLCLLFGFILFALIEYYRHQKNIYSIPIRIHINGTRGKSSVTRLIGAGLRAGGIPAITKVTGTYPRLILEDGNETRIYRRSSANIIEQLSIVRFAAARKVKALIIECMALQPEYQQITENKMIHATLGVITNVRPDHLDVMGPTLKDVGHALGRTIPKKGVLYTSEQRSSNLLKQIADQKDTNIYISNAESVSSNEMEGFSYIEHRENVALALAVCEYYGINRSVALRGMHNALPDEGVLRYCQVKGNDKSVFFFNALAANDPESSLMIWSMLSEDNRLKGERGIVLNTRQDRLDRARQLCEMIGANLSGEIKYLFLIGQSSNVVEKMAVKNGIAESKIINIGYIEPSLVYSKILDKAPKILSLVAMGNMGGIGAATADYFQLKNSFFAPDNLKNDFKDSAQLFNN